MACDVYRIAQIWVAATATFEGVLMGLQLLCRTECDIAPRWSRGSSAINLAPHLGQTSWLLL
jgi:hypothetical protein